MIEAGPDPAPFLAALNASAERTLRELAAASDRLSALGEKVGADVAAQLTRSSAEIKAGQEELLDAVKLLSKGHARHVTQGFETAQLYAGEAFSELNAESSDAREIMRSLESEVAFLRQQLALSKETRADRHAEDLEDRKQRDERARVLALAVDKILGAQLALVEDVRGIKGDLL